MERGGRKEQQQGKTKEVREPTDHGVGSGEAKSRQGLGGGGSKQGRGWGRQN
jgi:hypothetical protein